MHEAAAYTSLQPNVTNGTFHTVSTRFYRSGVLLSWDLENMVGSSEKWIFTVKILEIKGDLKSKCSMKNGILGPSVVRAACSDANSCLCVSLGVGGIGRRGVVLLGEQGVVGSLKLQKR